MTRTFLQGFWNKETTRQEGHSGLYTFLVQRTSKYRLVVKSRPVRKRIGQVDSGTRDYRPAVGAVDVGSGCPQPKTFALEELMTTRDWGKSSEHYAELFSASSGFFGPDAIRPFIRELVEKDLKAKKFKTKELEKAVRQALNPEEADEDEESEEEEEASEEEPEPRKPARSRATRRRGSAASDIKKKTAPSGGRRSKPTTNGNEEQSEESEDTQQASKIKRRSRKLDDEDKESEETHDTNRKRRVNIQR